MQLARLNADNHQLLGAESSLDEVRVHEALKDESPALIHELQRLEYKVNILLRLTAELALRKQRLAAAAAGAADFARAGMVRRATRSAVGAPDCCRIYINPALPQPLKIPCVVAGERAQDGARVAQMRFADLSERWSSSSRSSIFRHHRRLVAGAKHAASLDAASASVHSE